MIHYQYELGPEEFLGVKFIVCLHCLHSSGYLNDSLSVFHNLTIVLYAKFLMVNLSFVFQVVLQSAQFKGVI